MKILMINDYRKASGAETHLDTLERFLRAKGIEVTTWTPDDGYSWQQTIGKNKPDILHVHNFWRLVKLDAGFGEARAIFHTGIPTVLSLHDYAVICPFRMRLYRWRRCPTPCQYECGKQDWLQQWQEILQGVRLVTFNPGSSLIFRAHGMKADCIPHGIDLSQWHYAPREGRRGLGFVAGHNAYWWKGYETAKAIAADLKLPLLSIRGGSPPALVESLYRSCEVFVNSCIYDDTFGLTTVEAMACGAPVAAYETTGTRLTLDGLLPPVGNKEALTEQVQKLLHSQSDFGACNRARVETLFNAERMADDWMQLYVTILG